MLMTITTGPHEGNVVTVDPTVPIVLGSKGTVPLLDPLMSRRHACVFCGEDGRWYINDLGSTNGTFVNGTAIEAPTRLRHGDALRLGGTKLIVAGLGSEADAPPDTTLPALVNPNGTAVKRASHASNLPAVRAGEMPISIDAQHAVRRFLPLFVLAVIMLMIAALAAFNWRMQGTIATLRNDLLIQRNQLDSKLVSTVEQRIQDSQQLIVATDQRIQAAQQQMQATSEQIQATQEQVQATREQIELARQEQIVRLSAMDQNLEQRLTQQGQAVEQNLSTTWQAQMAGYVSTVGKDEEARLAQLDQKLAQRLEEHSKLVEQNLLSRLRPELSAWITAAAKVAQPPRVHAVFFVDCSGTLPDSMPLVYEEITRELSRLGPEAQGRILMQSGERLVEFATTMLPTLIREQASFQSLFVGVRDGVRLHEEAFTLRAALTRAMSTSPVQLFILSDRLGSDTQTEPQALGRILSELNRQGMTRIHTIHFFSNDGADTLQAVARENRGTYSFIPHKES